MSGTLLRVALGLFVLFLIGTGVSSWLPGSTPLESPDAPTSAGEIRAETQLSLENGTRARVSEAVPAATERREIVSEAAPEDPLPSGSAITGRVRFPDGKPAPGTRVELHRRLLAHVSRASLSRETTTDAEGRFALEADSTVDYLIVASRSNEASEPDYYEWRVERSSVYVEDGDLELVLERALSLSGRVVDDIGQPLRDFHLEATFVPSLTGEYGLGLLTRIGWYFESAQDGAFRLPGLWRGPWTVVARHDAHGQSPMHLVELDERDVEREIVLPRGASVRGRVVDSSGEPASGGRVQASYPFDESIRTAWFATGQLQPVIADEDGAFEMIPLAAGDARIFAATDAGQSASIELSLHAGQQVEDVLLRIDHTARVRGRLHESIGKIGYMLELHRGAERIEQLFPNSPDFEFSGLPAGDYRLELSTYGFVSAEDRSAANSTRIEFSLALGETKDVVLGEPSAESIRVRGFVTSGERQAADEPVYCALADGGEMFVTTSDAAGEFEFLLPHAGSVVFYVGRDQPELCEFEFLVEPSGGAVFELELPEPNVRGRLIAADGEPLPLCHVRLIRRSPQEGPRWRDRFSAPFAVLDGEFEIRNVASGDYFVHVFESDLWDSSPRDRTVAEHVAAVTVKQSDEALEIVLEPAARVAGVVRATDGTVIVGAVVHARSPLGVDLHGNGWTVITDEAGRFELGGLPGLVELHAALGSRSARETVTVPVGDRAQIELVMR